MTFLSPHSRSGYSPTTIRKAALARHAASRKEVRDARKAAGICREGCGPVAPTSSVLCEAHLAKQRAATNARRDDLRAMGLCMYCGRDAEGRSLCPYHLAQQAVVHWKPVDWPWMA